MEPLLPLNQITPETPHRHQITARQATTTVTSIIVSQTVTTIVTSTGPVSNTPTQTLTSPSPISDGPASSPILFIVLLTIAIILILVGIGLAIYCCRKRRKRRRRVAAREAASAGQELQTTATDALVNGNMIKSPAEREVYGYYAPTEGAATANVKSEGQAAAREVHGYFAPNVASRVGDGIIARPGALG